MYFNSLTHNMSESVTATPPTTTEEDAEQVVDRKSLFQVDNFPAESAISVMVRFREDGCVQVIGKLYDADCKVVTRTYELEVGDSVTLLMSRSGLKDLVAEAQKRADVFVAMSKTN
jgi:hypothetical protein